MKIKKNIKELKKEEFWKEEARQYHKNAEFWREKFEKQKSDFIKEIEGIRKLSKDMPTETYDKAIDDILEVLRTKK